MKGIIVFYVNYFPDMGQNADEMLNIHKLHNESVVKKMQEEGYESMFVATIKEACRVEKVDFDQPFPRYAAARGRLLDNKPKEEVK